VVVLTAIWVAAGPNSAAEISGDARFYLACGGTRAPTAPPYTYRVLTPWLAHLTGLDAFWPFAVVTIVGLALAAVLLWAVVLRDRTPRHAWLALGLFVVSPACSTRNRSCSPRRSCCCSPCGRARGRPSSWSSSAPGAVPGPPPHRLDRHGGGHEFPYFTASNLDLVVGYQGGAVRGILIALVIGLGPLAVAATLAWRSAAALLPLWALLLIPITLAVVIAVTGSGCWPMQRSCSWRSPRSPHGHPWGRR
jgi:hypothetical protein